MNVEDQFEMITQMRKQNPLLADALKSLADAMNPIFPQIAWKDEVLLDDFESVFQVIEHKFDYQSAEVIKNIYNSINESDLIDQYYWISQYGLCINIPNCYQQIIDEYEEADGRRGKLRIYGDFTAPTKEQFEADLRESAEDKTIICIVDNCLKDQYKAQEILDCINSVSGAVPNIIGTVFTSKESAERIDDRLCFVCTNKSNVDQLSMNIVRSAYHYFLKRLQGEITTNIDEAFRKARQYKYIANYLSQRAIREGISDYEVMQNWIRLMYEVQSAQSTSTKSLIRLAQIVDELEDEDDKYISSEIELMDDLNTWEVFDYKINDYHLPPMPGDVYITDDNKVFILIGQDCDMMMAEGRKRRVSAAELLPVELVSMATPKKITNNMEYVWLANYKHTDNQVYCMKVDYRQRRFIDGRILDLSVYNSSGNCTVISEIPGSVKAVLQSYLIEYHQRLRDYFAVIEKLRADSPEELRSVLCNDQHLFASDAYMKTEDAIRFPLRRICRLKQTYVFFLYKLYLEYRGRQPFDTINYAALLSQTVDVTYTDKSFKLDISVRLGNHSYDAKIHRLPWSINKEQLNALFRGIGINGKIASDDPVVILTENETELALTNSLKVKIKKKKDNQAILTLL